MSVDELQLHWSFNYDNRGQKPFFARALTSALQASKDKVMQGNDDQKEGVRSFDKVFDIMPNHWFGYAKARQNPQNLKDDFNICNGSVEIRCRHEEDLKQYEVHYQNQSSGEALDLRFQTNTDPLPSLVGEWTIDSINSSEDLHKTFHAHGSLVKNQGEHLLQLEVNGVKVPIGSLEESSKLTCNWILFDNMSALIKSEFKENDFVLLEDLKTLRPDCRIATLKEKEIVIEGHQLSGYCLNGTGILPTYLWLNQQGEVIIVSTTFQTFVLRNRI
jgi:hypothetical protein